MSGGLHDCPVPAGASCRIEPLVGGTRQFADIPLVVESDAVDADRHRRSSPASASSIAKTLLRMHSARAANRSSDTPGHQCPKCLAADAADQAGHPYQFFDHVRPRGQHDVAAVVTEGIVDLPTMVERPTLENFGLVDNKRAYIEDQQPRQTLTFGSVNASGKHVAQNRHDVGRGTQPRQYRVP